MLVHVVHTYPPCRTVVGRTRDNVYIRTPEAKTSYINLGVVSNVVRVVLIKAQFESHES